MNYNKSIRVPAINHVNDRNLYKDHLARLDLEARNRRFGGGVSDYFISRYVDACFERGGVVMGAFVDGEMRGVAEYYVASENPFETEVAFSIEKDWRRQGLGEWLFCHAIDHARDIHGIRKVHALCKVDNHAMIGLASKFASDAEYQSDYIDFTVDTRSAALSLEKRRSVNVALPRAA